MVASMAEQRAAAKVATMAQHVVASTAVKRAALMVVQSAAERVAERAEMMAQHVVSSTAVRRAA